MRCDLSLKAETTGFPRGLKVVTLGWVSEGPGRLGRRAAVMVMRSLEQSKGALKPRSLRFIFR